MQKRRPARGGADLQGNDRRNPNRIRPQLQANAAMTARLRLLLWCLWLSRVLP